MDAEDPSWSVLMTGGLALVVVGVVVLDDVPWMVEYSVIGVGLLLLIAAVSRASSSTSFSASSE